MKLYCVQCVTPPLCTNSVHMTGTVLHRWCFTAVYCKTPEDTYSELKSHFATAIGEALNATKNINIKIYILTCKSWCANVTFTLNFKLCHEIGFQYTTSGMYSKNVTVPICHFAKF